MHLLFPHTEVLMIACTGDKIGISNSLAFTLFHSNARGIERQLSQLGLQFIPGTLLIRS
jgi:hypothetical protein